MKAVNLERAPCTDVAVLAALSRQSGLAAAAADPEAADPEAADPEAASELKSQWAPWSIGADGGGADEGGANESIRSPAVTEKPTDVDDAALTDDRGEVDAADAEDKLIEEVLRIRRSGAAVHAKEVHAILESEGKHLTFKQ
eukprot:1164469-Prymnesium_polylepis.1